MTHEALLNPAAFTHPFAPINPDPKVPRAKAAFSDEQMAALATRFVGTSIDPDRIATAMITHEERSKALRLSHEASALRMLAINPLDRDSFPIEYKNNTEHPKSTGAALLWLSKAALNAFNQPENADISKISIEAGGSWQGGILANTKYVDALIEDLPAQIAEAAQKAEIKPHITIWDKSDPRTPIKYSLRMDFPLTDSLGTRPIANSVDLFILRRRRAALDANGVQVYKDSSFVIPASQLEMSDYRAIKGFLRDQNTYEAFTENKTNSLPTQILSQYLTDVLARNDETSSIVIPHSSHVVMSAIRPTR